MDNENINILAKGLKDRITIAAPLTMLMMTCLFERVILQNILTVASIHWFISVISFFLISSALVGFTTYFYLWFTHRCKVCKANWSRIRTGNICIETIVYRISLIQWALSVKADKIIKSHKCSVCNHIEHKKSTKYSLFSINTIK